MVLCRGEECRTDICLRKGLLVYENPRIRLDVDTKRADAKALVKLMQSATGERPRIWGASIIGFGSCHYTYESGREGDMPLIGFSPRKAATVLYLTVRRGETETLLVKLGKYTAGKICVYIKKLADVDRKVLETLIVKSVSLTRASYPG